MFYFICDVVVCVVCHFLAVPWFGLMSASVILVFPGHTHLLFNISYKTVNED